MDRSPLSAYQLRLPVFEGPLDLLLQLIERRQLDITTVSLALVTDQYLEHLRDGTGIDPEQLSEFIAVAAKLLLIKSMALLPQPQRPLVEQPPPPDPTDLTERLRAYEAIKQTVGFLKQREDAGLRSYPHVPPTCVHPAGNCRAETGVSPDARSVRGNGHGDGRVPLPVDTLLVAFRKTTSRRVEQVVEVARDAWSVADAIRWLLQMLRGSGWISFQRLVSGFGRARLVAAFLALLELCRQGRLRASQEAPFADVLVGYVEEGQPSVAGPHDDQWST